MFATLYEDESILAIQKPAGFFVHATDLNRREIPLQILCQQHYKRKLWPIHRLDKPTTGVLIFAKSAHAASLYGGLIQSQQVKKTYFAVVRGALKEPLHLDYALPDFDTGVKKAAITDFFPLRILDLPIPYRQFSNLRVTLLRAEPQSGRRHQIRRHCKHLSHPILGDSVYGDGVTNRCVQTLLNTETPTQCLFLHAASFELNCPTTGRAISIEAPQPQWFAELLGGQQTGGI